MQYIWCIMATQRCVFLFLENGNTVLCVSVLWSLATQCCVFLFWRMATQRCVFLFYGVCVFSVAGGRAVQTLIPLTK